MKKKNQKLNYRFCEAGVHVSCHGCTNRDLPGIKHILKELGLTIISIDIKHSGNA